MFSCKTYCAHELRLARESLKDHPDIKAKIIGMYIDGESKTFSDKYFWVRDANRKVIWEGTACCRYRARIKTIDKFLNEKELGYG